MTCSYKTLDRHLQYKQPERMAGPFHAQFLWKLNQMLNKGNNHSLLLNVSLNTCFTNSEGIIDCIMDIWSGQCHDSTKSANYHRRPSPSTTIWRIAMKTNIAKFYLNYLNACSIPKRNGIATLFGLLPSSDSISGVDSPHIDQHEYRD